MDLSSRLQQFVMENNLFMPSDRLLLAVSGGRDSVLMCRLFADAGYPFGIAHCNFKLRGGDSDADEAFVSNLARTYQVPFFSTSFDTIRYAADRRVSVQMAARELRYQWFETVRAENGFRGIALAHHQNDVVETMLLNMVRGTGIAGLHGILPKRDRLIRPLLFLKGSEVEEAVCALGLPYRDDLSNFSTKYARNKLRLEVIPLLKELNPVLEDTFMTNSIRFAEVELVLQQYVTDLRKKLFQDTGSGGYRIPLRDLRRLQPVHTLLFELFRPFGFSAAVLNDLAAAFSGVPGKRFLSGSHQLVIDREMLLLSPLTAHRPDSVWIEVPDSCVTWGENTFCIREAPDQEIAPGPGVYAVKLDAANIRYPLCIRSWKQGDVFRPLGMQGKKKLSDFFVNLKIPVPEKPRVPVVENGNGDIIWVVPYRIDDRYKITGETKKVLILERLK